MERIQKKMRKKSMKKNTFLFEPMNVLTLHSLYKAIRYKICDRYIPSSLCLDSTNIQWAVGSFLIKYEIFESDLIRPVIDILLLASIGDK